MRYQFYLIVLVFIILTADCSAQKKPINVSTFQQTYGKISETAKLSEARASHTATLLPNGKVIIIGGMERNGVFFESAEIFNPQTDNFTKAKGKMSIKRVGHTATLLPDGKILIVGGWSNRDLPESSAEIYDPKTDTFTSIENAHHRLSGHAAMLLDNGKVLIAGGSDGKSGLSDVELFNPQNNTFTLIGKMQSARIGAAAVKLADGRILLTGGAVNQGEILSSAEIFDPKTNTFTKTAGEFGIPLHFASVTLLADKRALIVGGYGNGTPQAGPISTNQAWIFKL